MIWKRALDLETLNAGNTKLTAEIGLEFIAFDEQSVTARFPVNEKTCQPYGVLHGGVSCLVAETMGSVAGNLAVDEGGTVFGVEINASHLAKADAGFVTGNCRAIRIGRCLQVWEIQFQDESGQLICVSRLTVVVRKVAAPMSQVSDVRPS